MVQLHDQLKQAGYEGDALGLFLVRLLFCLFANDTGIFAKGVLLRLIEQGTQADGSGLGECLARLFQTLYTPHAQRTKTLNKDLAQLPHIHGDLFKRPLPIIAALCNGQLRATLLQGCRDTYSCIPPTLFGWLLQSAVDKHKQRGLGVYYTTEQTILKVIRPLFLDGLYAQLAKIKHSRSKLLQFHTKLSQLRFLDPACGCGNFLITAYCQLRELEIQVLQLLYPRQQRVLDIISLSRIRINQFSGIELEELPACIAGVAVWLAERQMHKKLANAFRQTNVYMPRHKPAHIVQGNALILNWQEVLPASDACIILGNPPFVGYHLRTKAQSQEMATVFRHVKGAGVLDYAAAWYLKAAQYIQNTHITCAFVSTSSLVQGGQPAVLWRTLLTRYRITIHFAHRPFVWGDTVAGTAQVHVVIIGFAAHDTKRKLLYDYNTAHATPHKKEVKQINPYLLELPNIVIPSRRSPICPVPIVRFGSIPVDGGHFFLTDAEKATLLSVEPQAVAYIRPVASAKEFFYKINRWCLWLNNISSVQLKQMPHVSKRVAAVKQFRQASKKLATRNAASQPTLFAEIRQPDTDFLLISRCSSENRIYVPCGFFSHTYIVHETCACIPNATLYHFGVLSSLMHMEWMRCICGRLQGHYRYSNTLVYNNFPWPCNPTAKHQQTIEKRAQAVLDTRAQFSASTLADLYNPPTMPPVLRQAHQALDQAVDQAYRRRPFAHARNRMEFLLRLYQHYTA